MNEEVKQKWIAALESGEYKQGKFNLNKDEQFCCLGVLCDIYSKEMGEPWVNSNFDYGKKLILKAEGNLPVQVKKWSGLASFDGGLSITNRQGGEVWLSNLNDHDMPFSQIVDLIKYDL